MSALLFCTTADLQGALRTWTAAERQRAITRECCKDTISVPLLMHNEDDMQFKVSDMVLMNCPWHILVGRQELCKSLQE